MDTASALVGINHHGFIYQPVPERVCHWGKFSYAIPLEQLQSKKAPHCSDCGIPFCHVPSVENRSGCPVENVIPQFNLAVQRGQWKTALSILHSTNNFPEFTGRLCPAPCEAACTRAIDGDAVNIEMIEYSIIEKAFSEKWVEALAPTAYTGKSVVVIGSGPAGLACAQQLARKGHRVTVYEKSEEPGGLLRFGIPNFKMEKWVIDRRIEQMEAEGVDFICGADVGVDVSVNDLLEGYDAVVLAGGCQVPRDLAALGDDPRVEGRNLEGIHFAMELLSQRNWLNGVVQPINAKGKHVVVIGGGDTGSDCIGTSTRQGAASILQLEILPEPPKDVDPKSYWPKYSHAYATSSSQEEGQELGILRRLYAVNAQSFQGNGHVQEMKYVDVKWVVENGKRKPVAIEGSGKTHKTDLVVVAAGFIGAKKPGLLTELGVPFDPGGNVLAHDYHVPHPATDKIFAAGDMRRGQSLIVWGIHEGREAAEAVDRFLRKQASPLAKVPDHVAVRAAQYAQWAQQFTLAHHSALTMN